MTRPTEHTPVAYNSAYPGSMFEREDGGYIRRDDAPSLAAALLSLVKSGDRAAEDANAALTALRADRDTLAAQVAELQERLTLCEEERVARVPISTVDGLTDKERELAAQNAELRGALERIASDWEDGRGASMTSNDYRTLARATLARHGGAK